jgi:acetyltransferase-like isoleucine patch superfamily enzyme
MMSKILWKNMFKNIILKYYILINIISFKLNKRVTFGSNLRIRGPFYLNMDDRAILQVGNNFSMSSGLMLNPLGRNLKSIFKIDSNAKITIGNNVGMSNISIWSKESIFIGNDVKMGAGVIIMDSDMHSLDYSLRRNYTTDEKNAISKSIVIHDDVFIGVNSIITKGISIGEKSIIAAGSVVVKSIPSNEIWGGNPAVFIKKI